MSDNNECPVEDFMGGYGKTNLCLEFEQNLEDIETDVEVTVGYETNYFSTSVDPGMTSLEWQLPVSEFVDDYLDEDEQKALFYYLRDELLSSDTLTPAEINVPLPDEDEPTVAEVEVEPEEATTVPSLEPEEAPAASPATETVMASGIELRKQIESLLADEEAVAQVVMAMVNSGFAVSRVK